MPLFDPQAPNPGATRREVLAYSSYDFANSGYTTVVLTAVFNAHFVSVVAQGADWGRFAWTIGLSASCAIGMLLMPPMGAHADVHASKKPMLLVVTAGCILGTVALAFVGRAISPWRWARS